MTLVNIPAFSGLNITTAPQRMRDDEATIAVGCDFRSLDLRAFKGDLDSGLGTSSNVTGGASIFQWDNNTWLGALGDKSFARSPTFFSDASVGERIFVCDNATPGASPSEWDWIQEVKKTDLTPTTGGFTDSYMLAGTTKRLGVPQPGAMGLPKFSEQKGPVTSILVYSKKASQQNRDALVTTTTAHGLKDLNRVIIDYPGVSPVSTAIDVTADNGFRLKGTGRAYKECDVKLTKNSGAAAIVGTGHGLVEGDQILIDYRGANTYKQFPRGRLWRVSSVDGTGANLDLLVTSTLEIDTWTWTLDTETINDADRRVAFFIVARSDWAATQLSISQEVPPTSNQYGDYSIYLSGYADGSWSNAATSDTVQDRSYCVTFVNANGDESEPSIPTDPITVVPGSDISFVHGTIPYTADSNYNAISKIRLYRTDALGTFRLVTTEKDDADTLTPAEAQVEFESDGETPKVIYVDRKTDAELGEPLTTTGWRVPPKDVNGILISPGGSLVGYKGRGVVGSVPYAPYAFPQGNRVAFDYEVVGLVATSSGLVVVTTGMPALIVGDDPASWSIQKLEYPYGCVSRQSIVDMGEVAIYASADGLVAISGASVELLTKNVLTRAQWNTLYNPSKIKAAHTEGRYYATTEVNGVKKSFMFDPWTKTFVNLTVDQSNYPVAFYTRLDNDTLLILKSDGHVYEWNRGTTDIPYLWRSKYFQLTYPDIFGCAQILSPSDWVSYQLTIRLLAWDGSGVKTIAVASDLTGEAFDNLGPGTGSQWEATPRRYPFARNVTPFRLPVPNNRYTVYILELEGTLPVGQISVASTMSELKTV